MPNLPRTPLVSVGDGPLHRIRFRLWQIAASALVILVTGWLFTLSAFAGITAAFLAKHVLVAILAAGLDLHDPEREH